MNTAEIAIRQSLEIINAAIQDLCKRRDVLAGELPNAPREKMPTHVYGVKIGNVNDWKPKKGRAHERV